MGAEGIRRLYDSNLPFLFPRLEDRLRRWLRIPPQTVRAATVAGAAGVTVRLMSAMVATAFAGVWSDVPWGRWAVILVWYAVFDATQSWRTPPLDVPPGPLIERYVADWSALLSTVERQEDLEDLESFLRRWWRLPRAATAGLVVVAGRPQLPGRL